MKTLRLSLILLFFLVATTEQAGASVRLFSVDTDSDQLVQIDAATGAVTPIGPLGFDASIADLTVVGARLFLLHSDFLNRVDLHEIDPTTGASISSAIVQTASGPVLHAEGLAQVGGQLKIGYSTAGNPSSNALADLALNGLISNSASGIFDFDGLGDDSGSGQLYGLDVSSTTGLQTDFFTVNTSPLSINVFKTVPGPNIANDLVIDGNNLFAVDHTNGRLHTLDLSTDSFTSVDLGGNGTYLGLAKVVPEPASLLIWSLFIGVALYFGWRQRNPGVSHAVATFLASVAGPSIVVLTLGSDVPAGEMIFRDDFQDGSATDGDPVTWSPLPRSPGSFGVIDGDYVLTRPSNREEMYSAVDEDTLADVSVRAQGWLIGPDAWWLALLSRASAANSTAYAALLRNNGSLEMWRFGPSSWAMDTVNVGIDPRQQDVLLRFDVIGDQLSAWAWREGEPMPIDPQVTAVNSDFATGEVGVGADLGFRLSDAELPRGSHSTDFQTAFQHKP